jgi:hypothetical protein
MVNNSREAFLLMYLSSQTELTIFLHFFKLLVVFLFLEEKKVIPFYIRRHDYIQRRHRFNSIPSGGVTIMKKIEKRNGFLFWNEDVKGLSILYINNDGFLEKI